MATTAPPLSRWRHLRIWAGIGLQSFGGGQATQLLVYRAFVTRLGMMTADEYSEAWGMCQIPPGINLLALATLIGWRLDRAWGVVLALAGLVLPSSIVTVALTSAYLLVSSWHLTAVVLRGVTAGVAGMGLVMAFRIVPPAGRQPD